MPFQPITIDSSVTRVGGGSVHVHEGYYLMRVVGNALSAVDHKADWPFTTWQLRIEDGIEGIGRTFQHTTTFKPDQQWSLGSLINAVGQDPQQLAGVAINTYQDLQALNAQLLGVAKDKMLVALVAEGRPTDSGQPTSDIKQMFAPADWDVLKKNNERFLQMPAAPTQAAAPAPTLGLLPQSPFGAPVVNGTTPTVSPELQTQVGNIFSQPTL